VPLRGIRGRPVEKRVLIDERQRRRSADDDVVDLGAGRRSADLNVVGPGVVEAKRRRVGAVDEQAVPLLERNHGA